MLESWLSSLKLARMAALSFCTTALSSAIVFAARTFRMNCFTFRSYHVSAMLPLPDEDGKSYRSSWLWPNGLVGCCNYPSRFSAGL